MRPPMPTAGMRRPVLGHASGYVQSHAGHNLDNVALLASTLVHSWPAHSLSLREPRALTQLRQGLLHLRRVEDRRERVHMHIGATVVVVVAIHLAAADVDTGVSESA